MQNFKRLLPSAANLIVFEAAGRLQSFTLAGRELGTSQAAVSYAIRNLEDQLGAALFRRAHRAVHLTAAGERFLADVTLGLSHIVQSVEEISARGSDAHVTLSVSNAFASMWMVPRLQKAREALPGIELRLQTSDRDLDIVAENLPLGIRGGKPEHWPHYESAPLALEEIFPVASPAYLKAYGMPKDVRALASHNLIHLEEPYRKAPTWEEWLAHAGVALPSKNRSLIINDYVSVVQAALNGQGIALGWRHLVEGMIADGRLARMGNVAMRTGDAFYVVWQRGRGLGKNAGLVRDWLVREAG